MSARIYPFEIGAKMKPPRLPANDLAEVNVQITEIQVTLEHTQETCLRISREAHDIHLRLDQKIDGVHDKLDHKIDHKIDQTRIELRKDMEKMQSHVDGRFHDMSTQIEQLRTEVKGIISWKDRAVGVIIAISSLCTTGISLALAAKTLF